jgi:hypothetical protein
LERASRWSVFGVEVLFAPAEAFEGGVDPDRRSPAKGAASAWIKLTLLPSAFHWVQPGGRTLTICRRICGAKIREKAVGESQSGREVEAVKSVVFKATMFCDETSRLV